MIHLFLLIFSLHAKETFPAGRITLKDGYYHTVYHLKIEENCKERSPIAEIEKHYRQGMNEGLACLSALHGNESEIILSCMSNLFEERSNPPKLLCGNWPFGKNILAVGSFPGSSFRHPYLWLSPVITDFKSGDLNEKRGIMFHEMVHNCGYTHGEGIEITSTCEDCCFNQGLNAERKSSACHICSGKYKDENDPEYVKELLLWSKGYKTWGIQNRERVRDVAIKNKNRESLKILLAEFEIEPKDTEVLIDILLTSDKQEFALFMQRNGEILSHSEMFNDLIVKYFN